MLISWLPERLKERLRRRAGVITVASRLENLRRAGFTPRKIIDAGAYRGEWTRLAQSIFPAAEFLMIEPQPPLRPVLEAVCASLPRARYCQVALGAATGTVSFQLSETNSRVMSPADAAVASESSCAVPMDTLARVARQENFLDADFLKLDLQGHELQALAGAGEMFGRVEVIATEVSVLRIGEVPLIDDVWDAFRARGYRLYDIFGFNHRPLDRALWQCDLVFVRADSALLASRQWC
jgi:FkbM family methyltransferase